MKNILSEFKSIENPLKREEVVRSILDIDFQISLELLQEALNDNNPIVRYAAVEEIGAGRIGLTEQLLVILRGDTDFMVRVAAAESLGMIGDPTAVPVLLSALSDRNALVRGWAATSLAQFPTEDIGDILKQKLNSERQHFVKVCIISTLISRGEATVSLLLPELRYRNYKVRCATATSLSELADKTNLSIIVQELSYRLKKEKYASVRSSICAALVRLAKLDRQSLRILEEEQKNKPGDETVAFHLYQGYVSLRDETSAHKLLEFISEYLPHVKYLLLA